MALYHNEGTGIFIDEAPRSAIGRTSLLTLTFACFFFDYDLDGRPDIFAANGHVADDIERLQSRVTYAQRPHLFRNAGKGFEALDPQASGLQQAFVGRGAAYADYDNDGDLDLFVTTNRGPARVFRNDSEQRQPRPAGAGDRHHVESRRHWRARRAASSPAARSRGRSSRPDRATPRKAS